MNRPTDDEHEFPACRVTEIWTFWQLETLAHFLTWDSSFLTRRGRTARRAKEAEPTAAREITLSKDTLYSCSYPSGTYQIFFPTTETHSRDMSLFQSCRELLIKKRLSRVSVETSSKNFQRCVVRCGLPPLYPRSSSSSLRPSAAAALGRGCPSASHALSRDPRTWASCSPELECALSFLCDARLRERSQPLANWLPLRCFPTSHLRLPSLICGQEPTAAPASAASPPSPFQLSTRPQNRAQNKISPNLPSLATSRPLTHLVFASYRNVADGTVPDTVVHASLTL